MKRRTAAGILCIVTAFAVMLTACSGGKEKPVYTQGMFGDVTADSPYREYIAAAYEMELMEAVNEENTAFGPGDYVSWGEAAGFGARLRELYSGGETDFTAEEGQDANAPYIAYALENGILETAREDYAAYITRAEFAHLLTACMPAASLPQVNTVVDDAIPDLPIDGEYAADVYLLYRAGVFTGEEDGSFRPEEGITRGETAQALARMAASNMRGKVTLSEPVVKPFSPELEAQPAADEAFFEDAAIVGNSLVEGLRLYSNLKTITYYSGTSMSVVSAIQSEIPELTQSDYAKIYIELGINELGNDVSYFKEQYSSMIDTLKAAEPEAEIYIMSVLPVSEEKSNEGYFTMSRIATYNEALYEIATEKECYYLDVFAALVGADGYLPAENTWDGVHLTAETYSIWEECIRTHYAVED